LTNIFPDQGGAELPHSRIVARKFLNPTQETLALPNLIELQTNSYRWFITEGLSELLAEISPIDDFTGNNLSLYFEDFHFEEPKYDQTVTKEKNISYEAPLKVKAKLVNKVTGEVKHQEIFMGDYPWMTERGTFIINGVERVVVSQLVRSSGVFFTNESTESNLHGAKIIPNRGAWLEFETAGNGIISVKIDRKRKFPVTTLLRAFGFTTDEEIRALFKEVDTGDIKYIDLTL